MATDTNDNIAEKKSTGGAMVAKASAIMMVAIFLSRILGQLRDTVIAAQFGQNAVTDIYRSAFAVPDILYYLIAGGALSASFIPVFTDYITRGKSDEAWKVFSIIASFMLITITGFIIIFEIFAEPLVLLLRPGFAGTEKIAQTAYLTRILLPSQLCFFLGGLMFATFYSRKHYLTPALGPNLYNLGIIIGGLSFVYFAGSGIEGFAWGALIGAITGSLLVPMFTMSKLGVYYQWSLNLKHPGVVKVGKMMIPVVLGLSLPSVYGQVNNWFASYLADGSISALDQANRLMQAPLGILGQSIALAVFPILSEFASKQDYDGYRKAFDRSIRGILFLTIPVSALMIIFSSDITRILFQYGKFTSENTNMTALALVYYGIGIFAWSSLAIIQRGFYALQNTLVPVMAGAGVSVLFIPMSYVLQLKMNFAGLALATSIAAILQMILLLFVLNKRVNGIGLRRIIACITRTSIASIVMAAAAWSLRQAVVQHHFFEQFDSRLGSLFILFVIGCISAQVFLTTAKMMKMDETEWIYRIFNRLNPNKNSRKNQIIK